MLSQKCKYALRAVLFLANNSKQKSLTSGRDIAEELRTPVAFTVKILQELARKKLVLSVKGPHGGFYIDDQVRSQNVIDVIFAIDGNALFHQCGIGLQKCSDEHPCPFHTTFKAIRNELFNAFSSKTIGDFCVDHTFDTYFLTDEYQKTTNEFNPNSEDLSTSAS